MTEPAQMVVLCALKSDKQQKSEKGNKLKGQLVILPTSVVYSPTKDLLGKGNSVKLHIELREQKNRMKKRTLSLL